MKRILLMAVLVCAAVVPASAQKFGYVNSQELVLALPEVKEVEANLQKMGEEFMLQIEEMQVEGNRKLDEYQKTEATLSESMRKIKQDEISVIGQRIDELQANAQQRIAQKEDELMEPLIEKVRAAIQTVMKKEGLAGVIEGRAFVAVDDTQVVNLTPKVKTELGV